MKDKPIGFFILLTVVVCMVAGFGLYDSVQPKVTQGEEIGMVQPKGQIWSMGLDHYNSETNLNNSEANRNNSQAHNYDAQAELNKAQADYVETLKNNAENPPPSETALQSFGIGFWGGIVCIISIIIGILFLVGIIHFADNR